uniref:CBM21 domain-containing protein n=1 Tax=Glossina brevipalpis TaxID=37001 RepID=A0A1A9WGB4_9MUSC
MNETGDISLNTQNTHSSTPDTNNCSLKSVIPTLGMSSCRGKAEAFARHLSSKLRTLGSQADESSLDITDETFRNGDASTSNNTWLSQDYEETAQHRPVTELQPLRHDNGSFFDYDCELESPGSPVDECEYLRLIESTTSTPYNSANRSDYGCASLANSQCPSFEMCSQLDFSATESQVSHNNLEQRLNNGIEGEEQLSKNLPIHVDFSTGTLPIEGTDVTDHAINNSILQELQKHSETITDNSTNNDDDGGNDALSAMQILINGYDYDNKDVLEIDKDKHIEDRDSNNNEANNLASVNLEIHSVVSTTNLSPSPLYTTTDDEDDCRPQRVRRCSSLKTGKTPPGTPSRKKIVRFADVLGLDLADVKTFLDEIPTIPKSAFEDLEIIDNETPIQFGPRSEKMLIPLFQQPGGLSTFLDLVREKLVVLENAAVTDSINHTITGCARVRNLDFHKSVHVRYTLDGWRSYADLQANYVQNSCDGFSDKFTFVLFGNSLHIGQRLEFAVRFQCKGQQYWDNNYGINYCFQCLPSSTTVIHTITSPLLPSEQSNNIYGLLSPTISDAWCSSFY